MDAYRREYELGKQDQLWLVIDRDRWEPAMLTEVAQQCSQKGYKLAVSNPCFELWLLLHFAVPEQVAHMSARVIEEELRNRLDGSFNKTNYDLARFRTCVEPAIERAESMDTDANQRWPSRAGTRVYLLAQELLQLKDG